MKVKELIKKLEEMPEDAEVWIWPHYNAGVMITDFTVELEDGDVLLEG